MKDASQLTVTRLPKALICLCFSYLDISERHHLYRTCKTFQSCAQEPSSFPPTLTITPSNVGIMRPDRLLGSFFSKRSRIQRLVIRKLEPSACSGWLSWLHIKHLEIADHRGVFDWGPALYGMTYLENLESLTIASLPSELVRYRSDEASDCRFFTRCSSLTSCSAEMKQRGEL